MATAAKAHRSILPSGARNVDVPDVHDVLTHIQRHIQPNGEESSRAKALALLIVMGVKRPSDLCRTWLHERCLRFDVIPVQTTVHTWYQTHDLLNTLVAMGFLPKDTRLPYNYFIRMRLRAYHPKTSKQKNRHFGNWTTFMEAPFYKSLCPVRALTMYLFYTFKVPVERGMKYGDTSVTEILDESGKNAVKARPLFISLNQKPRKAIMSNTASGILKRSVFQPLNMSDSFTPYVLRGMAASWMMAYGVPKEVVKQRGNWSSDDAFNKHYRVDIIPRVAVDRLKDIPAPTWTLLAAHHLHRQFFSATDVS